MIIPSRFARLITLVAAAFGMLLSTMAHAQDAINRGTVTLPTGIIDSNTSNNSSTDTNRVRGSTAADLAITKTDGVTSVDSGSSTTYTITVSNPGSSSVTGSILTDPAVTGLSVTGVTCGTSPGVCVTPPTIAQLQSGYALPALAPGATYSISVTGTITADSGSLSNKATIAVPTGFSDTNLVNNSATDTNTVTPVFDLIVSKSNGTNAVSSGTTTTYTITVLNQGPSSVTGAVVTDTPGAGLTCPGTNPVALNGNGVPAGSFTVSDLTGGGITIGTLSSGQSLTLVFDCTVN